MIDCRDRDVSSGCDRTDHLDSRSVIRDVESDSSRYLEVLALLCLALGHVRVLAVLLLVLLILLILVALRLILVGFVDTLVGGVRLIRRSVGLDVLALQDVGGHVRVRISLSAARLVLVESVVDLVLGVGRLLLVLLILLVLLLLLVLAVAASEELSGEQLVRRGLTGLDALRELVHVSVEVRAHGRCQSFGVIAVVCLGADVHAAVRRDRSLDGCIYFGRCDIDRYRSAYRCGFARCEGARLCARSSVLTGREIEVHEFGTRILRIDLYRVLSRCGDLRSPCHGRGDLVVDYRDCHARVE